MRKNLEVLYIDELVPSIDGDNGLAIGIQNATTDEVAEFIESYGFKIGKDTYGYQNSYYEVLEKEDESAVISIFDENTFNDDQIDEKDMVIVELSTNGMKEVPKFYIDFFKAIFSPHHEV